MPLPPPVTRVTRPASITGHPLDNEDTGHDRVVREVTLEERFVLGDVLYADGPHTGIELLDPVHKEEGVTVRYEIPDLGRPERRLHGSTSPAGRPSTSPFLKSRNILVSVPSSPASKILRTPRSTRHSTTATHRTGESIWCRNASRTSSAVVNTAPSVAPTIGITGSTNSTPPRSSSISRAAPAMSGEWKAPDTSSFTFRPLTRSATSSSASFCPEMTVWRGVLKFAATTIPSAFSAALSTLAGSAPIRATIPPGLCLEASLIRRSLSATSRTPSARPRLPAAWAAAYSP